MQWLAETVAAAVQAERYMATDSRMTLVAVTMCLDYSQQVAYLLLYVLFIKTYIYIPSCMQPIFVVTLSLIRD